MEIIDELPNSKHSVILLEKLYLKIMDKVILETYDHTYYLSKNGKSIIKVTDGKENNIGLGTINLTVEYIEETVDCKECIQTFAELLFDENK